MTALGIALVVVGAVLLLLSQRSAAQAHPGRRLPLWGRSLDEPRRAVLLRGAGGAAVIVGVAVSALPIGVKVVLFVVAFLPALAALLTHNRTVGARSARSARD